VRTLKEDFRKRQEEVRADLAEAGRIWNETSDDLKSSKKKYH
jgi:hypothetical protein